MVRMDGDAGDKLRAAVPPRPLVAGTNDVGDIQLAALPLVVAGRFVFDRPRSQRDVGFAVECRADTSGPDGQTSWRPLEDLLVDRDDDGGFRVHGEVPPLPLRLAFPAADHLPVAPIGFAPGTTGLEVPIELGNSLLVHALLPECLAAGSLSFELLPAVPPTTGSDALDRMHGETGDAVGMAYARWPALPAGVYTLQVRSRGCADLLAAFQDLRVPDPGNEDQTVEIDLRERLHVLRVNVVLSGSSDHDPDAVVILDPVAGELPSGAHIARDGMLCLPVPPRPVDLLVGCEGWRPQTVRAAQGPVEVRLEPWPRVALLVRGLPDLPADGAVWVSLRPTEPTERRLVPASRNRVDLSDLLDAPRHSLELHHDGVGELPIGDAPRRIEVMLNLGSRWCVLQATTPEVVQPGDASVTVQLSTAAVQQAILGLQTRK
jgi:hypothetical protein